MECSILDSFTRSAPLRLDYFPYFRLSKIYQLLMKNIHSADFTGRLDAGDRVLLAPGLSYGTIEQTITPDGSATYDLDTPLPAGAVVVSASLTLSATVVATTAVKIGLGRKEATADPDKYALTADLLAGTHGGAKATLVLGDSTADETLQVVACATGGGAAGTLDSGGTITAKLTYVIEA
jgi:hypothetical protein